MVDVSPEENIINITVSQAKTSTLVDATNNMAKYYEEQAKIQVDNARIWTQGTDEEVAFLGGEHSAKGWTETFVQKQSDWTQEDDTQKDYIKNKPNLSTVATSGSYEDLLDTPDIPTKTSDLTNDLEYQTASDLSTALADYVPTSRTINGQALTSDITLNISEYTKFAINKGKPDLLINNSNELAFDVDNNPLTYTNIMGETKTVTDLSPIDVSAENDGTYKVALPKTGNQPYLFGGNIFIQEDEPTTQIQSDIWLNPQEPYSAKQYDGVDWQDFNDVLLLDSSITVSSGLITALTQPTYNYNGIELNQSSNSNIHDIFTKCSPDWSKGVSKNANGFTADENGWLKVYAVSGGSNATQRVAVITINNTSFDLSGLSGTTSIYNGVGCLIPIVKNDVIAVSGGYSLVFTFYPLKGV